MFDPGKHKVPIKEFRSLIITIDSFIYFILNLIFKVFFNIVNANFLDNDIIETFYSNIELLIGLFITFRLSFSLINYLINPDSFSDSKVGAGKMIIKIITALCMLTMIIPLSGIPDNNAPDGSYNQAIKQKGIAFGTLQFVQDRILSQNIIGKLVLGIGSSNNVSRSYKQQANTIVAGILKGFIYPAKKSDGSYYCNKEQAFQNYQEHDNYNQILHYADGQYCDDGDKYYAFSYVWLGSWICGAIFIVIVAGFCVDVAIRLIKLTILRLIAPIPIISYINPNSEKSGAFSSWVKMVTSTYLDLFLRIGLIYLVVYICSTLIGTDAVVFQSDSGVLNTISKIFIWIGLFMFAKQAPKFLKDVLGIKSDNKGFFSGVGTVAGFGAIAAGSAAAGFRYGRQSYKESDMENPNAKAPRRALNIAKAIGAGAVGAGVSGTSATNAALRANDHKASAAINAAKHRALVRETGSTFGGRARQSLFDIAGIDANRKDNERIAINDDYIDAFKYIDNQLENDMTTGNYSSCMAGGLNALGQSLANTSLKDQVKVLEAMEKSGTSTPDKINQQKDLIAEMKKQRYAVRSADVNDHIYNDVKRMKQDADKNNYTVNVNDYSSVKGLKFEAERDTHTVKQSERYINAEKLKQVNKK